MEMKFSNKCKPIPKEYQVNSSHQTAVQIEEKLILIRRCKTILDHNVAICKENIENYCFKA